MCSGSEAGSYLRLIDFVYHSILGLRVIKKKKVGTPHAIRNLNGDQDPYNLSIRCILGDIRLWVGDTSTSSCLV